MPDLNSGAKDHLKLVYRAHRLRMRKPSVAEILVLGLQNNPVPVSSARVPDRKEERRGVVR